MPTLVSAAGWDGMAESAAGCEVAAAGWPVTTPSELVCWRKVVWGKGSTWSMLVMRTRGGVIDGRRTEQSARTDEDWDWAKAAAAKAVTAKAVRMLADGICLEIND